MFSNMRYVYEVYKAGSFSKAAKNLYISQPSLSATVKKTEAKIGMPLFDRSMTPVQLTDCGKKYIEIAERMMDMQEEFSCYVGNLGELRSGHLNVGGTYLFMVFVLPAALQEFHKKYPEVKLQVYEGHTSQLEAMLFSGDLDLVVDNYPMDESVYGKQFFMEEHLLLAVPAAFQSNESAARWALTAADVIGQKHLEEKVEGVPLTLFQEEPFVVLRAHNDTRERVETICRNAGVMPHISLKLDQMLMAYRMSQKGMGISFVSDTVVRSQIPDPSLVYYKISDPEARRNVYFYYKRNKFFSRSMEEFIKIALNCCCL